MRLHVLIFISLYFSCMIYSNQICYIMVHDEKTLGKAVLKFSIWISNEKDTLCLKQIGRQMHLAHWCSVLSRILRKLRKKVHKSTVTCNRI